MWQQCIATAAQVRASGFSPMPFSAGNLVINNRAFPIPISTAERHQFQLECTDHIERYPHFDSQSATKNSSNSEIDEIITLQDFPQHGAELQQMVFFRCFNKGHIFCAILTAERHTQGCPRGGGGVHVAAIREGYML